MNPHDTTVVITGGHTGIGAATTKLFADLGATVYVLDVAEPPEPHPKYTRYICCDVSHSPDVERAFETIKEETGFVDLFFSNAGVHHVASLEDTTLAEIDHIIGVNLMGTILTLRQALPIMKKQRRGRIVLMGSDQCFVGKAKSAIYGLTKGAIGQLTKSTAIDCAPFNVQVNCVCPGTTDTTIVALAIERLMAEKPNFTRAEILGSFTQAQPIKRLARPEEIADVVKFLLCDAPDYMTGSLIPVDGGYTAQ